MHMIIAFPFCLSVFIEIPPSIYDDPGSTRKRAAYCDRIISQQSLCSQHLVLSEAIYRYYELPKGVLAEMQNEFLEETLEHF